MAGIPMTATRIKLKVLEKRSVLRSLWKKSVVVEWTETWGEKRGLLVCCGGSASREWRACARIPRQCVGRYSRMGSLSGTPGFTVRSCE